jgi:hypothetical protein
MAAWWQWWKRHCLLYGGAFALVVGLLSLIFLELRAGASRRTGFIRSPLDNIRSDIPIPTSTSG